MDFKSTALLAAKRAGRILLHYYGKKEEVKEKSNKSLVSKADLDANRAIISTIKKYFPEHSILSEETPFHSNNSDYKWVIDPLDGTHNFLHDLPLFGTSIALEHDGKVILGVIHFPALCITACAEKGKGAFMNGKRMKVSNKKSLDYAFVLGEYSKMARKGALKFMKRLKNSTVDTRIFGCAIYDLLLVASGKAEAQPIFFTNEWDVAAGFLIVEEAGGRVTDYKGREYDLKNRGFAVSNGKVHDQLLRLLK